MGKVFIFCMLWLSVVTGAYADYMHSLQVDAILGRLYSMPDGDSIVVINGSENVTIQVFDTDMNEVIWEKEEELYIDNGSISLEISDSSMDWVEEFSQKSLIFRLSVLTDIVDIEFEVVPYSTVTDYATQARQFNDPDIITIDYEDARMVIGGATSDAALAVSGDIVADYYLGDGAELTDLTGTGLNDGHSLNSLDGIQKDVVFVSDNENVGINTTTPSARLHVKGDVLFRDEANPEEDDYQVPSGNILLWDSARSAFRSGYYSTPTSSSTVGKYTIGFGSDVHVKSLYSSILGGDNHLIDSDGNSSVILGGQGSSVLSHYSVAAGGYGQTIDGQWNVILGGEFNQIDGNYSVIIGGEGSSTGFNSIDGDYSVIIGDLNAIEGDFSSGFGSGNTVSADYSVALGTGINIFDDETIIYSDGSTSTVNSSMSNQIVFYSENGMGINMVPMSGYQLSVSGDVTANYYSGDGRYIENVESDLYYFDEYTDPNDGIVYTYGNLSIGTSNSKSTLTVIGGLTIGQNYSDDPPYGTIRFSPENGLEGYISSDEWVTLDAKDINTSYSVGLGLTTFNANVIRFASFNADEDAHLITDGDTWDVLDMSSWDTVDGGISSTEYVGLGIIPKYSLHITPNNSLDGTSSRHPLVIGLSDTMSFDPETNSILFNLVVSNNTLLVKDRSALASSETFPYAGQIVATNDLLLFNQTKTRQEVDTEADLTPLLTLSSSQVYRDSDCVDAVFDMCGAVSFVNTMVDHSNLFPNYLGLGHKNQMDDPMPYYFYQTDEYDLFFNSGFYKDPAEIQFYNKEELLAYFNTDGELILGGYYTDSTLSLALHNALAKLTIVSGNFSIQEGTYINSAIYAGDTISMGVPSDFSHDLALDVNDEVIVEFGSETIGINTENVSDRTVVVFSDTTPNIYFDATGSQTSLMLQDVNLINNDDTFYLNHSDNAIDWVTILPTGSVGFFTDSPTEWIEIKSNVQLSNTDALSFVDASSKNVKLAIYRSSDDDLNFIIEDHYMQISTTFNNPVLVVSTNAHVGINSDIATVSANLYVSGNVKFRKNIYYSDSGTLQQAYRIQSFTMQTSSNVNETVTEHVRSIETLIVDQSLGFTVTTPSSTISDMAVIIKPPGVYEAIYMADADDNYVSGFYGDEGKDMIRFSEYFVETLTNSNGDTFSDVNGGVSISVVDTDQNNVNDAVLLYNTLLDGDTIYDNINISGNMDVDGYIYASGAKMVDFQQPTMDVDYIPYWWQIDNKDVNGDTIDGYNLYYLSGNVGIGIVSPNYDLDVYGQYSGNTLNIGARLSVDVLEIIPTQTVSISEVGFIYDSGANNNKGGVLFSVVTENVSYPMLFAGKFDDYSPVGLFTSTPNAEFLSQALTMYSPKSITGSILIYSEAVTDDSDSPLPMLEFMLKDSTETNSVVFQQNCKGIDNLCSSDGADMRFPGDAATSIISSNVRIQFYDSGNASLVAISSTNVWIGDAVPALDATIPTTNLIVQNGVDSAIVVIGTGNALLHDSGFFNTKGLYIEEKLNVGIGTTAAYPPSTANLFVSDTLIVASSNTFSSAVEVKLGDDIDYLGVLVEENLSIVRPFSLSDSSLPSTYGSFNDYSMYVSGNIFLDSSSRPELSFYGGTTTLASSPLVTFNVEKEVSDSDTYGVATITSKQDMVFQFSNYIEFLANNGTFNTEDTTQPALYALTGPSSSNILIAGDFERKQYNDCATDITDESDLLYDFRCPDVSGTIDYTLNQLSTLGVTQEKFLGTAWDYRPGTPNLMVYDINSSTNFLIENEQGTVSINFRVKHILGTTKTVYNASIETDTNGSLLINNSTTTPKTHDIVIDDNNNGTTSLQRGVRFNTNADFDSNTTTYHGDSNEALYVSGDVKATALSINGNQIYPMPIGGIVMFSGLADNIPKGWVLADGGTYYTKYGKTITVPDLSGRFVKGMGRNVSDGFTNSSGAILGDTDSLLMAKTTSISSASPTNNQQSNYYVNSDYYNFDTNENYKYGFTGGADPESTFKAYDYANCSSTSMTDPPDGADNCGAHDHKETDGTEHWHSDLTPIWGSTGDEHVVMDNEGYGHYRATPYGYEDMTEYINYGSLTYYGDAGDDSAVVGEDYGVTTYDYNNQDPRPLLEEDGTFNSYITYSEILINADSAEYTQQYTYVLSNDAGISDGVPLYSFGYGSTDGLAGVTPHSDHGHQDSAGYYLHEDVGTNQKYTDTRAEKIYEMDGTRDDEGFLFGDDGDHWDDPSDSYELIDVGFIYPSYDENYGNTPEYTTGQKGVYCGDDGGGNNYYACRIGHYRGLSYEDDSDGEGTLYDADGTYFDTWTMESNNSQSSGTEGNNYWSDDDTAGTNTNTSDEHHITVQQNTTTASLGGFESLDHQTTSNVQLNDTTNSKYRYGHAHDFQLDTQYYTLAFIVKVENYNCSVTGANSQSTTFQECKGNYNPDNYLELDLTDADDDTTISKTSDSD